MLFQWKTSEANQLTQFYKSMLQHFLEVIVAYICAFGRELALFNNKKILIGTQTIFYKEWFPRKEFSLYRSFNKKMANFLHYQSSSKKYEVWWIFDMQVVSAKPKHLLNKAKEKK